MAGAAQASSTTAHDYVYNLTWVTKIKDRVRSMPLLERFSALPGSRGLSNGWQSSPNSAALSVCLKFGGC